MKRTKISIADILTILIGLLFGYYCFLSFYFLTLGDLSKSITNGAIISVLLITTAIAAKNLKRTSRNFKSCFIGEIIFLVIFSVLLCFFSYSTFSHYFYVSTQKEVIQNKLNQSIEQADNMFKAYENYAENRENQYESKLQSIVLAYTNGIITAKQYIDSGFVITGVSPVKQINTKLKTLHTDLFPLNYSDSINKKGLKDIATTWFTEAKTITNENKWKPIGIIQIVNEVDRNSANWLGNLILQSKVRETCENAVDFTYSLTISNVKIHFTQKGKILPIAITLSVLAYFLMLFSYIITKRSTKTTIGFSKRKGKFDIEY